MNKFNFILLIVLLITVLGFAESISTKRIKNRSVHQLSDVIFTKDGGVRGTVTDTHRVWYGIPFAQPPIDELRFDDPKPVRSWKNIRDGTVQRDQCVQECGLGPAACSPVGTSEDCLYLDVFVPRSFDASTASLPVMVFIPGGAFTMGTGACPLYDASYFANSSVIVVNTNYRLGALGFMGTDLLSGNFGFLDQVKALEWVRDNIHAFGGNKDNVSLYGQSAGGFSVVAHLVSPFSKGLFHRAIVSSTPFTVGLKTRSIARGFANKFAGHLGCGIENIECLRSKSAEEIMLAQGKTGLGWGDKILDVFTIWTPVVDCSTITGQPLTMIRDGLHHDVPVIIGDLKDEANLFIYATFKNKVDPIKYSGLVSYLFGWNAMRVGLKYPCSLKLDCRPQLSKLLTDYLFHCPSRYFVNKSVKLHNSPVYHYFYQHISSGSPVTDECEGLTCHGDELSMIFNTYFSALGNNLEDDEVLLAQDLSNYWVNFIRNNDPNIGITTETMPKWTPINSQSDSLVIQNGLQVKDIISLDERCSMFDDISYRGYTKPTADICPY